MKHYKSVFDNEQDLLEAITSLHGQIELDPMYFKGNFYKRIPEPKYKYDIAPQVLGVNQADARNLPHENNEINNMILDPPFMFGGHGKQAKYYSSKTHGMLTWKELFSLYVDIIHEARRVLKLNGTLYFKCQDYTDSKTTMTHVLVHNLALLEGFYAKDLAILVLPNKVYNGNTTQRHLRKIHTYFWVFKKVSHSDSQVTHKKRKKE